MKATLLVKNNWTDKVVAVLMFESEEKPLGMDQKTYNQIKPLLKFQRFNGKFRTTAILSTEEGIIILSGLGKRQEFEPDRLRVAVARTVKRTEEINTSKLGILLPAEKEWPTGIEKFLTWATEGGLLASYRYHRHRQPKPEEPEGLNELTFISPKPPSPTMQQALTETQDRVAAVYYTRDLINEPAGNKFPLLLAKRAAELTVNDKITVQIIKKSALEKMGMGGIVAVGKGSATPPCLLHLTYTPRIKPRRTLVIVGKGVTFDSGGLSLKTADQMETMKDDMAGAAVVLGLFHYLTRKNLPVLVHGLAPLAENLPSGTAQKPGDIIRHYNGKTVEVINTDAEGRLLLADALAYGATLKPDLMIDIATLTGACVIALGDEISGIMGNSQQAIDKIIALGQEQGELFWQLPLTERYRSHLKSPVADIKNTGKPRVAGTIIAGLFLSEFVPQKINWVHIDIAGTAFSKEERDYYPPGATGIPLRTIIALIANEKI